jgi:hypothetical protein
MLFVLKLNPKVPDFGFLGRPGVFQEGIVVWLEVTGRP